MVIKDSGSFSIISDAQKLQKGITSDFAQFFYTNNKSNGWTVLSHLPFYDFSINRHVPFLRYFDDLLPNLQKKKKKEKKKQFI